MAGTAGGIEADGYVRPVLTEREFRGVDGELIRFGRRWGDADIPSEAYSAVTAPERFSPLHSVADALVEWVERTFEVRVSITAHEPRPPGAQGVDLARSVRIAPQDADVGWLTVGFTRFPGITLHVDGVNVAVWPFCGCDACDEDVGAALDDLEEIVVAVVTGAEDPRIDGSVQSAGGLSSGSRTAWPRRPSGG